MTVRAVAGALVRPLDLVNLRPLMKLTSGCPSLLFGFPLATATVRDRFLAIASIGEYHGRRLR
jgi:hypothetical protein